MSPTADGALVGGAPSRSARPPLGECLRIPDVTPFIGPGAMRLGG